MTDRNLSTLDSPEPQLSIADTEQKVTSATKGRGNLLLDLAPSSHAPRCSYPQPLSISWSGKYLLRNFRTTLPLAVSDQAALFCACWLGSWAASLLAGTSGSLAAAILPGSTMLGLAAAIFLAFSMGRLYPAVGLTMGSEVRRCTFVLSLVFGMFLIASLAFGMPFPLTLALFVAGLSCLILVPLVRRRMRQICGRFRWWKQPVLIFGNGSMSNSLARELESRPHLGLFPSGIFGDIHRHWSPDSDGYESDIYVGPPEAAAEMLHRDVDRVIVIMPERPTAEFHKTIDLCAELFPHITVVTESNHWKSFVGDGDWTFRQHSGFECRSRHLSPLPHFTKRALDLAVVFVVGSAALPFVITAAMAIKICSPGPILFSQERIGRGGRRFRLWKFRTMVLDAETVLENYLEQHPELRDEWEREHKLEKDPRVIRFIGHILRRTSLDELPQLWNVWKGEMSLVGPRPLPKYHLKKFDRDFLRLREKVTPGLTGLWQVASRHDGRREKFVKYDTEYIRHWSLLRDLRIIVQTVRAVLRGKGAV